MFFVLSLLALFARDMSKFPCRCVHWTQSRSFVQPCSALCILRQCKSRFSIAIEIDIVTDDGRAQLIWYVPRGTQSITDTGTKKLNRWWISLILNGQELNRWLISQNKKRSRWEGYLRCSRARLGLKRGRKGKPNERKSLFYWDSIRWRTSRW